MRLVFKLGNKENNYRIYRIFESDVVEHNCQLVEKSGEGLEVCGCPTGRRIVGSIVMDFEDDYLNEFMEGLIKLKKILRIYTKKPALKKFKNQ